jgi:hypothetical protein
MNEKITLTVDLANAVLAYMGRQPYEHVFQIIQRIQDEYKAQQITAPSDGVTDVVEKVE